jgi:hypothetical protein
MNLPFRVKDKSIQGNFEYLLSKALISVLGGKSVQFGATGFSTAVTTGDGADFAITLPVAWSKQHLVFIANVWPGSTWSGFAIRGSVVASLTQGLVHVQSSTSGQSFTVYWISIGS